MPLIPARIARAAALMALGLASPAAAQPWETARPPAPFLRPMAKPSPIQPADKPAESRPAPAAKTAAPKAATAKAPAPKAATPKAATPKPATPASKSAPAPTPARSATPVAAPAPKKPAAPAATPAATPRPPPAPAPVRPASAPPPAPAAGRAPVIIIDSSEIADPQTGVRQLARISAQLTQEFAARSDNVDKLKTQAEKAQAELKAAKPAAAKAMAPKVQAQLDQYEAENKSFMNAYNARSQALVVPVQRQVNDALTAFATARGATVVIDGSRFNDSVLMLQKGVNPNTLDLTRAFIDSYNAAHP